MSDRSAVIADFKCSCCGLCCRKPVANLTHSDLMRIWKHYSIPASAYVKFYRRDEIEGILEEEVVRFKNGGFVMGLKKKDGRCVFLSKKNLCRVHEFKPAACRYFPFECDEDGDAGFQKLCKGARRSNIRLTARKQDEIARFLNRIEKDFKSYYEEIFFWNTCLGGKKDEFLDYLDVFSP